MNPLCDINTDDLVFNVPIPLDKISINVFWTHCKTIHLIKLIETKVVLMITGNRSKFWTIKNRMLNFRETSSI